MPTHTAQRRRKRALPKTSIAFFVGIGLIINEAGPWNHKSPNALLLFVGLAMCGFPVSELGDIFLKKAVIPPVWEPEQNDEEKPEEKS